MFWAAWSWPEKVAIEQIFRCIPRLSPADQQDKKKQSHQAVAKKASPHLFLLPTPIYRRLKETNVKPTVPASWILGCDGLAGRACLSGAHTNLATAPTPATRTREQRAILEICITCFPLSILLPDSLFQVLHSFTYP